MFDIGFLELLVIFVIGLLVVGPEKLPQAARTVAMYVARIRRFMRDTRAEFEQQIGADEIRRELHNEQVMKSLEALKVSKQDIEQHIVDADKAAMGEAGAAEEQARKAESEPADAEEPSDTPLAGPPPRPSATDDPTLGTDDNPFADPSLDHDRQETDQPKQAGETARPNSDHDSKA